MATSPQVVIIGGGITGLAAAWELQQQGIRYTLLEASNRLGGKIRTDRADGFVIEGAADSFLTQKPAAWQLCREIGLSDRIIGTNEAQRNVYMLRHGKLHLVPRGLRLIVPLDPDGLLESDLLSEAGKHRMLAETEIPPRTETGDESLAAFIRRRFGEEALAVFGDSLLAGIHVADPEKLSLAAAFPNYQQLERTYGSVITGMQQKPAAPPDPNLPKTVFVSLRNGVYELIEGLQAALTGDVRVGQSVTRIDADRTVHTASGETYQPDVVILTTPARAVMPMVSDILPEFASQLSTFRTVSSATVSLGYRADQVDRPIDGTGFVIPRSEPTRIVASTWSSTKLPYRAPEGHVLLRAFFGGSGRESDVALPDAQLIEIARQELGQIMGIHGDPVISRVFRWQEANPQYDVGHLERVAALRDLAPSWLKVTGCSYEGIGIPDCVRQGRETARHTAELIGSVVR